MLVTLDTSAVIAVAAGEPTKAALVAATRDAEFVGSGSLPAEVGNALSAMFKRGRVDLPEAERILQAYRRIAIDLVPLNLDRSLQLASELDIYIYDAFVLDCARSTGTPLLSLDRGQRAAAARAHIALFPLDS